MKNRIAYILCVSLTTLILTSCENEKDVRGDLENLKIERTALEKSVKNLSNIKNSKSREINSLDEKLKELKIYESGETPQYILEIRLKQSHFSLDIGKHMKDEMNSITFEIPVDKKFYHSVTVGTEIVDEFRNGSFILNGSIGNWKMTVKDKEIR